MLRLGVQACSGTLLKAARGQLLLSSQARQTSVAAGHTPLGANASPGMGGSAGGGDHGGSGAEPVAVQGVAFSALPLLPGIPTGGGHGHVNYYVLAFLVAIVATLWDLLTSYKDVIFATIKEQLFVSLEVRSNQPEFEAIITWAAAQPCCTRARNLMLSTEHKNTSTNPLGLVPGLGTVRVEHNGRSFWLLRRYDGDRARGVSLTEALPQVLTILLPGRSRAPLEDLLRDVQAWHHARDREHIKIYVPEGTRWMSLGTRRARHPDTLFLPDSIKQRVLSQCGTFIESADAYAKLGIPWRRGFLFTGPPGTGKSSLTAAVAGMYGLPLYLLSLSGSGQSEGRSCISDDAQLMLLLNSCETPCIIAIEDIDTSPLALGGRKDASSAMDPVVPLPGGGPTLSGLLNALDGAASTDGRILIMTANSAELIPPALRRPGRIDEEVVFTEIKAGELENMYYWFHSNNKPESADGGSNGTDQLLELEGHTPAQVQNLFLRRLLYNDTDESKAERTEDHKHKVS